MNSVVLCARIVLTVVFATAGVAKLVDLGASRITLEAFGLPRSFARFGGTLLPMAELAVAAALLPQQSARWGAVAALALLLVFNAGVGYALSVGRTPNCNCFGQLSSEAISWRTLARNTVFAVCAGLVIGAGPGSALSGWTSSIYTANLVAALAVVAAALLALTSIHFRSSVRAVSSGAVTQGPEAILAPGSPAPDFALPDLAGTITSRDSLLERGLPLVLIFASPSCGPCQALIPEVGRWHSALSDSVTLVIVESGARVSDTLAQQMRTFGDFTVLVDSGFETASAYRANVTPTAIAISPDGSIFSPPLPGADQIEALVRTIIRGGSSATNGRATHAPAVA